MWHETNTYAAHPTTLADFRSFELLDGHDLVERNAGTGSVIGGFLDAAGLELVPCFSASAWPGGIVEADAFRYILDRTRESLREAGVVDGVLVNLHGAMVAESDTDPESTLLREIAAVVGDVPVVAVLDLHANPSPDLVERCDAVIGYDTYPHVDMRDRGCEAAFLLRSILEGRRLTTVIAKLPLLVAPLALGTADDPMRGLLERARARARDEDIARVSITGGFAYSDVPRAGISVLVVCDVDRIEQAEEVLRATVDDVLDCSGGFRLSRPGPAEAVAQAIASPATPVVVADIGDNVGGGSPGDGTAILRELIEQDARDAVVVIADPVAVVHAESVGVEGEFRADVGGKTDRLHGEPVHLVGRVTWIGDATYRTSGSWMSGAAFTMGRTAVVDAGGTLVVLTYERVPPFHREQLTCVGIDPASMNIIVAKGAVAWRAAFGGDARAVIEVDTPGICPVDPLTLRRETEPMTV